PASHVYDLENTFWTDHTWMDLGTLRGNSGGGLNAGGGGGSPEHFYLRNNLFRMTKYGFDVNHFVMQTHGWDEDFDVFGSLDGVQVSAKSYTNTSAYRAATKEGAHSNVADTGS